MAFDRNGSIFLSFFLLCSVAVIVNAGNDTSEDEYWKQRATVAMRIALESAHPDPHEIVKEFNAGVHKHLIRQGQNKTRRALIVDQNYDGPCMATNPIDACWRCDPHWADNRQRLAHCVQGFGKKTTGGKGGPIYVVTDGSDDDVVNPKPGTLRHAVIQDGPLWIIFEHGMVINLTQELMVSSNKTIDGRGSNIAIIGGAGITLQYVDNVIISNLHIKDIESKSGGTIRDCVGHAGFRTESDGDGISLYGATNVWIDHVSMARAADGLIDAIMASTCITISNSHFTHHDHVMLFGANDAHEQDKIMQVTLAFNHFGRGLVQRMPRCRFGFFHVVNNDYTQWVMYAIGGNMHPTIISQGNRFIAPETQTSKEVTKREKTDESGWKHWNWRSEGDVLQNGAFFVESGTPNYKSEIEMMAFKPGRFASLLTKFSGTLECRVGEPC